MFEDIISGTLPLQQGYLSLPAIRVSGEWKGQPVNVRHVGRQLGVRYVEGSVRRAAGRVRHSRATC